MILPIEKERVHCFVRGLSLQLRIETKSMILVGRSFLYIVDHTHTIEELHHGV